jgi:bifunctional DNA-binding transcriptional regulator/antitoxin component of YhaV-PrlF toxin-antitoxin module
MRFLRKLGQRGSLTLPSELREVLAIGEGDIVEFEVIGVVRRSSKAAAFPSPAPSPSPTADPIES